jgi:hypothetical protein
MTARLLLLPCVLLPLVAADFWAVRDPAQWSEAESKRMVTGSPWAKEAAVRASAAAPLPRSGGPPPPNDGSPPVPSAGSLDAGAPAATAPSILVRWESAAPVTDACAQGSMDPAFFSCYSKLLYFSGSTDKWTELARAFYVVSMTNYPRAALPPADRNLPLHSAAATTAYDQLGERIRQGTFLKRKDKPPVPAARIIVLPAGQALLAIALFPRSETITREDKDVTFDSTGPTLQVAAKFTLSKMQYKSRLEL